VPTPGFPLPLRNGLAALVLAALDDDDAYAALAWVAGSGALTPAAAARLAAVHLIEPGGDALLPVHAPHATAAGAHAARGLRAADTARRIGTATDPLTRACRHAVALWGEGLFFEVHEELEQVWKTATGEVRQALQGVIQVAVAFHHLAHGNRRGAKSLLAEGRARVAAADPATLPALDLADLHRRTATWETTLAAGTDPAGTPPPLVLRG
jgi:hypothetical protein